MVPGETKRTSRVITSEIGVVFGSRPARTTRISRSRSEKMPPTRPSSVITSTAPISRAAITSTASATIADAGTEIISSLRLSRTTPSTSRWIILPPASGSRFAASSEIVEQDVLPVDAEREQHRDHGLVHRSRAAHVVLDVLRRRVVLQIPVVQHIVDEADGTVPVVLGQRLGQRQVPLEVRVLLLQRLELVDVERLAQAPRAIPEGDLAPGGEPLELVEDVRAHRRHPGAAADEAHLACRCRGRRIRRRARPP